MSASIILFEDHTWRRFRPVATGTPVFELRCGAFNARERARLAQGAAGVLLARPALDALHTAADWERGVEAAARQAAAGPCLLLSGRVPPRVDLLRGLAQLAAADGGFLWEDEAGVVAAGVTSAAGGPALEAWRAWAAADAGGDAQARWAVPDPGWTAAADGLRAATPALLEELKSLVQAVPPPLGWVWDMVGATAAALAADADACRGRTLPGREPFGIHAAPESAAFWRRPTAWRPAGQGGTVLLGDDASIHPSAVVDATRGPVLIDRETVVGPHTYLEGPLYLGPGCRVKPGAAIYGESSFGIGNRLAGEIGESTFGDFANKQHDGFIGHAVCGSWINLGAMTTCSDLKNNYGDVRVDLGDGPLDTQRRFVGVMLGDHVKTAIGTLFNTGTVVGFATNVFGAGMPPKSVAPFRWGGHDPAAAYAVDRAVETAGVVMARRGCAFRAEHEALFRRIAGV